MVKLSARDKEVRRRPLWEDLREPIFPLPISSGASRPRSGCARSLRWQDGGAPDGSTMTGTSMNGITNTAISKHITGAANTLGNRSSDRPNDRKGCARTTSGAVDESDTSPGRLRQAH